MGLSDRERLRTFKQRPGTESFHPFVERYLALVYSAARRRTGDEKQAEEVARAVFLVLARRARKLGRKTVLAGWLYEITRMVCRKLPGGTRRRSLPRVGGQDHFAGISAPEPWTKVAPELDFALDRLRPRLREAVLLRALLGFSCEEMATTLRISVRRAAKRAERGLERLAKRLRRRGFPVDRESLASGFAAEICSTPPSVGLASDISKSVEESFGKRTSVQLVRRTLRTLGWIRWRRRLAIGIPCLVVFLAAVLAAGLYVDSRSGSSRLLAWFIVWSVRHEGKSVPGLAQAARPWPTDQGRGNLDAASIRSARDLYQITNIWLAHLKFSSDQWKSIIPRDIGPLPNFVQRNGTILLRNPKAQRSGLAGVLGYDFDWVHAEVEFGGVPFSNVGARMKGNGTYLGSLYGWKRSFKVEFNRFVKAQKLGEVDEINFTNLIDDRSYLSDTLAYELFRDAGVPAPRTAYAWLRLSVAGQWDQKPLGLYVLIEPVGGAFAAERFGSKKVPVFKPVTYELFADLGGEWSAYAKIYDLKTKATAEQQRRVIDFARLVSHAPDPEFAERLETFLDLDEFAGFLAGEVFLSSYDSILSNGQNFYLYLDAKSDKFGFIPWDLDHAWGNFPFLGTARERERASIWHPWVGQNRFLERLMSVEKFRQIYRARLEDFSARLFVPTRLFQQIDEIAKVIRSPVAAESTFRLEKFELAVGDKAARHSPDGDPQGANRPVLPLKHFIENRARSVRRQLDGKSKGIILNRGER